MPALTGPIQIFNVGGGVAHFGDAAFISPKSVSKTANGSGSSNTAAFVCEANIFSITATAYSNLLDQPLVGNN